MTHEMNRLGEAVIVLYEPLDLVAIQLIPLDLVVRIRFRMTISPRLRIDVFHVYLAAGGRTFYRYIFRG